jgi:hypothetical protein
MKTILFAGAMTLAIVGNVQAGWFGLTEDYPLRNPSADRTLFIVGGVKQCVADTRDANFIGLSRSQICMYAIVVRNVWLIASLKQSLSMFFSMTNGQQSSRKRLP